MAGQVHAIASIRRDIGLDGQYFCCCYCGGGVDVLLALISETTSRSPVSLYCSMLSY